MHCEVLELGFQITLETALHDLHQIRILIKILSLILLMWLL